MTKIDLDSSRILHHVNALKKWQSGEKVYPITIDMCLSKYCGYQCIYCYGALQKNEGERITWDIAKNFLDDCKEVGVKAISLVSDSESTCNPIYKDFIVYCKQLGIDIALGSNGHLLDKESLEIILPHLTYLRFNISAGTQGRYAYIHGVPLTYFDTITENIDNAVRIKKEKGYDCTIGTQMVLMPEFKDDIIPLAQYAIDRGVDYLVIKHCSDSENSELGIDYTKYAELETVLKQAESMSTEKTAIVVKWSKIKEGNHRDYQRCYAPPLHLQISGTGLCAPCGFLFNDRYKEKFHIGNFCTTRFKDILNSDRYKEVMDYLASENFTAGRDCGTLCLQHLSNKILDKIKKGEIDINSLEQKEIPKGYGFI